MKYKREDILLIEWIDSGGTSGWIREEELGVFVVNCETTGFFIERDDVGITVALNRCLDIGASPFGEIMSIPNIAIKKITRLRGKKV